MYCRYCGKVVDENSKFCRFCGHDLSIDDIVEVKPTDDELKVVASDDSRTTDNRQHNSGNNDNDHEHEINNSQINNNVKPKQTDSLVNEIQSFIFYNKLYIIIGLVALIALLVFLFGTHIICFHKWDEATCTEPKMCDNCGKTIGKAKGHDYEEATCTEPKTCKNCDNTIGEPLGHEANDASCTEDSVCDRCGEVVEVALGHSIKKWTTVKKASCTDSGKKEGTCKRCGKRISKDIDQLGHNWSSWESDGWTKNRTCSRCGKTQSKKIPAMSSGRKKVFSNKDLKVVFDADTGDFEFTNKTSTKFIVDFTWDAAQCTLNGHQLNVWDMKGGTLSAHDTLICNLELARSGETLAGEKMREGKFVKKGDNVLMVQFHYGKPDKTFDNIVSDSDKRTGNFKIRVAKSVVDLW